MYQDKGNAQVDRTRLKTRSRKFGVAMRLLCMSIRQERGWRAADVKERRKTDERSQRFAINN